MSELRERFPPQGMSLGKFTEQVGVYNTVGPGRTLCFGPGSLDGTDAQSENAMPFDGVISRLYCISALPPGAGESFVYTLRVNGADSILTATISGAVDTQAQDLTNTVSVSAGDLLNMKIVTSGTATVTYHMISFEVRPF